MQKQLLGRLFAALLAVLLVVSISACGAAGGSSTAPSTPQASTGASSQAGGGEGEMVTVRAGHALAADFSFGRGESLEDNAWKTLYAENGINMEVLYNVDPSTANDKLAQTIASGNYPDIFTLNASDYVNYASQGVIADITDVYEQYLSDLGRDYLAADGGVGVSVATLDGRMYGLPVLGNSYDSAMLLWVRQDWLDKLDLEVPKTVEDMVEVARAFTERDPDGNGQKDTYGLGLNGKDTFNSLSGVQAFFEPYGVTPGNINNTFPFLERDGELIWGGADAEAMKQGLEQLSQMYTDGLIPPDFITASSDQIYEDAAAGKFGMYFAPMWGTMAPGNNALAIDPNTEFTCIGTLTVGDGPRHAYLPQAVGSFYVMSSKFEHPEVYMKAFDLAMEKLVYAKTGEDYATYNKDGTYSPRKISLLNTLYPYKNHENYLMISAALESGDNSGLNVEQTENMRDIAFYLEHKPNWEGMSEEDFSIYKSGRSLYGVFGSPTGGYAALDSLINADDFMPEAYNALPTQAMSEKFPILDKTVKEFLVNVIVGNKTPADYDAFLESWYAQGGEEITAEANAWYQASK